MSRVCLHRRIVHSAVGDRCADCSEVLTVTEHSIRDCSHLIWRIMPPPYPDRFPCPQCGEWVKVRSQEDADMLTNDEIDRQVALIEGWEWDPGVEAFRFQCLDGSGAAIPGLYSYLGGGDPPPYSTEWSWCGPLLEKMQASVFFGGNFTNITTHPARGRSEVTVCDDDAKRAICLAFIESAGGNRVEK